MENATDPWVETPIAPLENQEWHHLPARGAKLAALGGAVGMAIPAAFALGMLAVVTNLASPWVLAPVGAVGGAVAGAWLGYKRHRR